MSHLTQHNKDSEVEKYSLPRCNSEQQPSDDHILIEFEIMDGKQLQDWCRQSYASQTTNILRSFHEPTKKKITRQEREGTSLNHFKVCLTISNNFLCLSCSISVLGYLGLSRCISLALSLFWAILVYLGASQCISVHLGASRSILVYLGQSRSISVNLRLSRSISVYIGLSGTIWDYISGYLRLSQTILDYLRLP